MTLAVLGAVAGGIGQSSTYVANSAVGQGAYNVTVGAIVLPQVAGVMEAGQAYANGGNAGQAYGNAVIQTTFETYTLGVAGEVLDKIE